MRLTLTAAVLCCTAIGAAVAYKAPGSFDDLKAEFDENKRCWLVPTARNISLSLREALRITRYQSEIGQDKWVAETMFPGITNGFFLDVGSGDGYMESNTQALEARGWKGICIDPFPGTWAGAPATCSRTLCRTNPAREWCFTLPAITAGFPTRPARGKKTGSKAPGGSCTTSPLTSKLSASGDGHILLS